MARQAMIELKAIHSVMQFLDSRISMKTRPYAHIIYGHNMKNGAMFGSLRYYENSAFYHNEPFITFDTMYERGRYVIFAVGTVSVEEWGRNYGDFYGLRSVNAAERQAAIDAVIAVWSSPAASGREKIKPR